MKKDCKVIAVTNQKGGVGKTTTTESLGIGLANSGKSVLVIDFDPQGDLTSCLGWKNNDALEHTISEAMDQAIFDKDINYDNIILKHEEGIDVIPSNIDLADFEMKLVGVMSREKILSNCIEPLKNKYDYILIDCPPSLGILPINALGAADEVLIPVQAQYLSAKGMTQLLRTIHKVQHQINPNLKITGIAITLANMQTNLAKSTVETIQENFGRHINVFKSIIPVATKAGETTIAGQSIYKYAKDNPVAIAYENLTKEVINLHKPKTRNEHSR